MDKFTPLAKFYTAAGSDGIDKFHLWITLNIVMITILIINLQYNHYRHPDAEQLDV